MDKGVELYQEDEKENIIAMCTWFCAFIQIRWTVLLAAGPQGDVF